ncbi:sulfatase-like hydrolase/transferase [Horticoccus sp. 23ND18S-11]|uniref:sulfatase-like hydrolase/transferase n=1 Tax=Horticoccus sp. 23ND18S-11 TaxID=3391832 RepID=UPI0039C9BBE8
MIRFLFLLVVIAGWTSARLVAQTDPAGVRRTTDVIYAKHDGVALTMDVLQPAQPNGAGIIRVVSGGWRSSHRSLGGGPWPQAGYTTFVVVHGTQPRFNVEEIGQDLLRAVRFIRANAAKYGVDPEKLGITGGSAGGHLSLMVGTRGGPGNPKAADPIDRVSSAVQAVACYYPPTDFMNWSGDDDVAVGVGGLSWLAAAFGPDAVTPAGRARLGHSISPITGVHAQQPPIFIVHGDADTVVPLAQAERFFRRSKEAGARIELRVRQGAGHGGWTEMREDDARMVEWFDQHLLGRRPAQPFAYASATLPSTTPKRAEPTPPNIVVIYADDLGYGDLGCYGSPTIRTPHLDRLAAEGMRFTDFYSAAEVCTPSRAALLTGRYPPRSGMAGARRVLFPNSAGGLPASEVTLAEALKPRGYATAHIGKWHLGIHAGSRPNDQGFDLSFGLPYSNDMDARPDLPRGSAMSATPPADGWNVALLRNGEVVERPVDQSALTARYTAEAVKFIQENRARPFFLYFAHTFPHVPLFASPAFRGRSRGGIYGDTVEELDASVGEVVAALKAAGVAERTLVIFSSDNGPWLTQKTQGGSAGLLREGKGSTWEGGMRVPGIVWMPGKIGPAVTSQPASTLDIFSTALALAGAPRPADRVLDGRDLAPVLFRQQTLPPQPFIYYRGETLMAVRLREWKLHFHTQAGYGEPAAKAHEPPLLFDLGRDPGERFDVAADHPEIVAELKAAAAAHTATMAMAPTQLK